MASSLPAAQPSEPEDRSLASPGGPDLFIYQTFIERGGGENEARASSIFLIK